MDTTMKPRLAARLTTALLSAALLLPTAAHAERVVVEDATNDVVTTLADSSLMGDGDELVAAPDHASTDITRTVVDHRAGRLTVTASFRDLRRSFGTWAVLRVRTSQRTWTVFVEGSGGQTVTAIVNRSGATCRGLLTTVDPAADTVSVRVPTACIRDPRWVQVAMLVASREVRHDPRLGDQLDEFADDAFADGMIRDSGWTMGPKVRRG